MKKIISLLIVFSLFLSSCSTLTNVTSNKMDEAAKAAGIDSRIAKTAKKAIPKQKSWDDGDITADADIVYSASKSQKYLNNLLKQMLYYSTEPDYPFNIFILRSARVQGFVAWSIHIEITRGMFNMIYDEA